MQKESFCIKIDSISTLLVITGIVSQLEFISDTQEICRYFPGICKNLKLNKI